MKQRTLTYIKNFSAGEVIHLQDVYSHIYKHFPKECDDLGFTGKQVKEPRWKNEVRQGFHLAEYRGLIKHVDTTRNSQEWERI
jgi:hypothetical protein